MQLRAVHESLSSAPTLDQVRHIIADRAEPLVAGIVEAANKAAQELRGGKL